ncbi:MAG TPA: rod shape-determining protein MreC [Verrucomicrobiales bacterium]|nr:rod shape-determining protein MreC [Verrucomicrobiales bacterium]
MFKRPLYIFCVLALLLVVLILVLQTTLGTRMKLAIGGLFLPLFGLSSAVDSGMEKAGDRVVPRSVLVKELSDMRRENDRLRILGRQAQEVFLENQRLRIMLGRPEQMPWKVRAARVVGRDPANWWHMIHIDLGSRDGVTNSMPVIAPDGSLVGRVGDVGHARSQVILVGDPNCPVSVLIQETREHGVIAPSSINPFDQSIVELGYLSRNSILRPDQIVVTSGKGGIFPSGILVGRIIDFQSVDQGLYTTARVKLAMAISRIEEVWVIQP